MVPSTCAFRRPLDSASPGRNEELVLSEGARDPAASVAGGFCATGFCYRVCDPSLSRVVPCVRVALLHRC